ncbi:hypothetical protein ACTWQL_13380 [Pseudalkalibacillus sp. R45]
MLHLKVVDFRSRMLAFRGACREPTSRLATLNGLTCPAVPQESRTLLSNQLAQGEFLKNSKATIF